MEAEIAYDDTLRFPGGIVWHEVSPEKWLVVTPDTANWIVVYGPSQTLWLRRLIAGETIGDVAQSLSEDGMASFSRLLSGIMAREFASVGREVVPLSDGHKLRMLNIYLTNGCNLRCPHCFMSAGMPLAKELTARQWMRILSEFKEEGGKCVTITGGEPASRKDFGDILAHAHGLGLQTTVLTNGTLWTQEMVTQLSPLMSEVQVSVDGADETSNSVIRGAGNFKRATDAVVWFANAGVRTSMATTLMFENLTPDIGRSYGAMVKEISHLTGGKVFFKLSKKLLPGRDVRYTQEQNARYGRLVRDIEAGVAPDAVADNFMKGHQPNEILRNCGMGGLSISASGDVYFCNRLSESACHGNALEHSLKHFMQIGNDVYEKSAVEQLEPCSDCFLRYICGGGCRIDDCRYGGEADPALPLRNTTCTSESRAALMKKMVDGYEYLYDFG